MIYEIPLEKVLTTEIADTLRTHGLKAVGAALIVEPTGPVKRTYRVVEGDRLGSIAKRYNVLLADLIRINNIKNPNIIHPGQILEIP